MGANKAAVRFGSCSHRSELSADDRSYSEQNQLCNSPTQKLSPYAGTWIDKSD